MREDTPGRANTRIRATRKTIAKIMTTTTEPATGTTRMSGTRIITRLATGLRTPSLLLIAIHSGVSDLVMDMAPGSTCLLSTVIILRIIIRTDITRTGTESPIPWFRSTADRGHSDRHGV